MNTASEFIRLVREPARRPRTVRDVAAELIELGYELDAAAGLDSASAPVSPIPIGEASALVRLAARLLEEAAEAEHQIRLRLLEQLCARCGHERGDHLVDAPYACEGDGDGDGELPCKCPGYTPPGQFGPFAAAAADTMPAPPEGRTIE